MNFSDGKSTLPAASAGNAYKAVLAAIKMRDLERAHNLLRGLFRQDGEDPNYLLLLAWTAPTKRTAQLIFRQFQDKYPDHPKAKGEVLWSGVEWAKAVGDPAAPVGREDPVIVAPPVEIVVPEHAAPTGKERQTIRVKKKAQPNWWSGWIANSSFYTFLGIYMAGITLAEAVTTYVNPLLGLVLHGGLLLAILLHTALAQPEEQKFLLALALAPLIRLVSLTMPLLNFEFKYWYMVIGVPLLIASAMVYRMNGYRRANIGLVLGKNLPLQLLVAVAGVGLGYMEYQILKPEPLTTSFNLQAVWLPALILLVFTGFLEELIFRGLMQRAAAEKLRKIGPFYISLLFAVLHIGYNSLLDLVFVFLVGFVFSLVVTRTRSLLGVTIAHGLTNISLFLIFPFVLVAPIQPNALPVELPVQPGIAVQTALPEDVVINLPAMWQSPPTLTPRPTFSPTAAATATLDSTVTSMPTLMPATLTASPTATWYFVPLPTSTATMPSIPTAKWTKTPLPTATGTLESIPSATPTLEAVLGTSVPIEPTPTEPPPPTATEVPSPTPSD